MLRRLLALVPIVTLLNVAPALANTLWEVPSGWQLINYKGSDVTVWWTSSPCLNGNISLPKTFTEADRNRFVAMILYAKATSRPMGIWYTLDNGSCVIDAFYVRGQS